MKEVCSSGLVNQTVSDKTSEEGPLRQWLKRREPLLPRPRLLESPVTAIYPPGVDAEIERKREAKRIEWERKGYPPALNEKALILADRWISSMAGAFEIPGRPEIRAEMIRANYDKALGVAENWIIAMMK